MRCFLCGSKDLSPAFPAPAPPYSAWSDCGACGSQTAAAKYDRGLYPDGLSVIICDAHGIENLRRECRGNADWFDRNRDPALVGTFLDVGCGDGAMLDVMAERGWSVHGFDVTRPHYFGPHVTVSPVFHRDLFPMRYAAVNCREVIEHVPNPHMLLDELKAACLPGGLVQVQTPQPSRSFHPGVHSAGHLFVASPGMLREMIGDAGLEILDAMLWGDDRQAGQAYLCRNP